MALPPGTLFGSYEIAAALCGSDTDEAYRARDLMLGRDVVLKILPDGWDTERLVQFQRVAHVLASLNHSGIAAVYGLETAHGVTAVVTEYVKGPTLADRIARGAIPIEDALRIARQIAEVLEAAHARGIIHLGLTPANITIVSDGTVRVLDYGLAQPVESVADAPDVSQAPAVTRAGRVRGSAAYMSPEQARGEPVDQRADIWAFGCVLYEMLASCRAFESRGESVKPAELMTSEPDWDRLPSLPGPLEALLRQSLRKDPRQRGQAIGDLRLALDGASPSPSVESESSTGMTCLVAMTVVALATWLGIRPTPGQDRVRFTITPPEGQVLTIGGPDRDLVIAPDGRHLVYQAGTSLSSQLLVRAMDQVTAVPLPNLGGSRWPFISADSHWLGFYAPRTSELRKISLTGGPPTTVCRIVGSLTGASWSADDTIVFATSDPTTGLLRVSARGGEPTVLTQADPTQRESDHAFPSILPDGHTVIFTIIPTGPIENVQVAALNLRTGQKKTLIRHGSQAEYVGTGHLLYAAGGTLYAVRFDLDRLQVLSRPVPVSDQVLTKANGTVDFSVSRRGTFVHVPAGAGVTPRTRFTESPPGRQSAGREIHLALNWFEELKVRVSTGK